MSCEIIPPSGDENSSTSEFFSTITKTNNITPVLNPQIKENETIGTDHTYFQLRPFHPSTSQGKFNSVFLPYKLNFKKITHITNKIAIYFRFLSI